MITKFTNEIVLGLFGVVTLVFNIINAGPLEITVIGGLMILAAIIGVLVELFDTPTTKKKKK